MRRTLERLDREGRGDGPLHRIAPSRKLLATFGFVVAAVLVPIGRWRLLLAGAVVLAFVVGISGVAPGRLIRRWLAVLPVVVVLAVMIAPGHPAREEQGAWGVGLAIVARNALAVLAVMLLAHVTPLSALIRGLGHLGAPRVLVATLQVMARYLFVLGDELDRMTLARRARSFGRGRWAAWRGAADLVAALFLRAFERGERVHSAMLARGWDGTTRSLDDAGPR